MSHASDHPILEATPAWRDRWFLLALLAFLCTGLLLFPGAGRDDAYITFWPAYSLAEFGTLANYNGDAIEQSSSLTLVLALAALRVVSGAPLAWLGWLFGVLCGALTLLTCRKLAHTVDSKRTQLAPLCLALAAPFTYWSFSGMETALQAFLVLGWVRCVASRNATEQRGRTILRLMPWTLALIAVRPEAMFVVLCVCLAATLLPSRSTTQFRSALWTALGLAAGILITTRALWFDSWLPQPAIAKAGRPLAETAMLGLNYLGKHPLATTLTLLAAGTGLWRGLRSQTNSSSSIILASLFVSAQLGFVVLSGGDWMEGARFLAPTLPLCFILLLSATSRSLVHGSLATLLGVATLQFSFYESRSLTAWQRAEIEYEQHAQPLTGFENKNLVHLRDKPTLIALEQIVSSLPKGQTTTLLTGQGGLVLYHLVRAHPGSLRVVDRYGLLDRTLSSSQAVLQNGSSALGLKLSYGQLLRDWKQILNEAKLEEPGIIFDVGIGQRDAQGLVERGYVEVYRQTGELVAGTKRQPAKQAIFIKRALAATLPQDRLKRFEFSQFQAQQ